MNSNSLLDFISVEREYYEAVDNNRFATSLSQAVRYYEFILIITERHQAISQEMVSNIKQLLATSDGSGVVKDERGTFLTEQKHLSTLVHLEIESFYLFAKIFLDKLSFFIQDYFGEVRGCSLISHDKLTKNHEQFRSVKGLVYPKGFSENLITLKEQLSDFRDKQISHSRNPRIIRPTAFDNSGQTHITITYLYPTERELESEQVVSKKLPELVQMIELYIQQIMEIVVSNRHKTRFKLMKQ